MKILGNIGITKLIDLIASKFAPKDSPNLTGTPTAETATLGTNTNQIATTAFVQNEISDLVGSAPETLNTLNELAEALGDDPNFATTIATQLGTKANASDLNNYLPLAGGTMTGSIKTSSNISLAGTSEESWIGIYAHHSTSPSFYGAGIALHGKSHSSKAGWVQIEATDASSQHILYLKPNGELAWNGNKFMIGSHAVLQYNATNQCLDFSFV